MVPRLLIYAQISNASRGLGMQTLSKVPTFLLYSLMLFAGVSTLGWAGDGDSEEFPVRTQDPFRLISVMPAGPLAGVPISTREKRSGVILNEKEAAPYKPGPGEVVIANLYHEGKFWIAKVPVEAVKDVYFLSENYSKTLPLNHSQIRFQMEPGHEITLYPQVGTKMPIKRKLSDLLVSVEAHWAMGDTFNTFKGIFPRYALQFRVVSPDQAYYKSCFELRHAIQQIKMNLKPQEKSAIFLQALTDSNHNASFPRMYGALCKSCTTEVFKMIDSQMHYRHIISQIASGLDISPITPRTYLYLRGLISANDLWKNPTPNFEVEFADLKKSRWMRDELRRSGRVRRAEGKIDPVKYRERLIAHGALKDVQAVARACSLREKF